MNKIRLIALVITCVVVAMGCEGCDDTMGPDDSITVTINGKTLRFTADPSVSSGDWESVKGKIVDVMSAINSGFNSLDDGMKVGINNMMDHGIKVINGSSAPAADSNKALVLQVGWLKSNNVSAIGNTVLNLANQGAFNP